MPQPRCLFGIFGHVWVWAGSRSASGKPTVDLYRCERCDARKEEVRGE